MVASRTMLIILVGCTMMAYSDDQGFPQMVAATTSPASSPVPAAAPPVSLTPTPAPAPASHNCTSLCEERCLVATLHKRCLKYCGICCDECKCVPSGHSGNKDECPCYRDKKSSRHTGKCP